MNSSKPKSISKQNNPKEANNPKVKIIILQESKSSTESLQKNNSSKVIGKKHSSINISPKKQKSPILYQMSNLKSSNKKPLVAHSVKNLHNCYFHKSSMNSDKKNYQNFLQAINESKINTKKESISKDKRNHNSKSLKRNIKGLNRKIKEISNKKKTPFISPKNNKTSIEISVETPFIAQSFKKRNKPLANIKIDIGNLTEPSNNNNEINSSPKPKNGKASLKNEKKSKKVIKMKLNESNTNNIQVINKKKKNQNVNKEILKIPSNSIQRNSFNVSIRYGKDTTTSSKKLQSNLSINLMNKSPSIQKKTPKQISLKSNLSGKINEKGIKFFRSNITSSSMINSITTHKSYYPKNAILNSSYDNYHAYSIRNSKMPMNTLPSTQQTLKAKLKHSKQLQNTIISSRYIRININHSNSPCKNKETTKVETIQPKQITTREFIFKYHKYLTIREFEEALNLKHDIYYIGHIIKRIKKKEYTTLNINNSYILNTTKDFFDINKEELIDFKRSGSENDIYKNEDVSFFRQRCIYTINDKDNDDEGDYILSIGDHLNYRFEIISLLGKGSFGEAVKCFDHKTNEYVCVKIVKSNLKFLPQAKVELKIVDYINKNEKTGETNIVKYYSTFNFRNHICLVFELLDINLYEYIRSRDFVGLEMKKIKEYTKQILFVLLFLKKHSIIHCDLKPENILLLKGNISRVKVIDFGSSCFEKEKLYAYIQSRFYRAPEVLLDLGYGIEIDMWSLGCILCELYSGTPIFPGENEREQLNYIMEYLDIPPKEYINNSKKKNIFFDGNNLPFQRPKGKTRQPRTKSIHNFLRGASEDFISFIKKCLKWEPEERITPEEALMDIFICGDMNFEELYQHKMKIKRIQLGLAITGNNNISTIKSMKLPSSFGSMWESRKNGERTERYLERIQLDTREIVLGNCLSQPSSSKNLRRYKVDQKNRKELSENGKVNKKRIIPFLSLND